MVIRFDSAGEHLTNYLVTQDQHEWNITEQSTAQLREMKCELNHTLMIQRDSDKLKEVPEFTAGGDGILRAPRVWVKPGEMKMNGIWDERTEGANCESWPLSSCKTQLCWMYAWINEGLLQLVNKILQGPPGHHGCFCQGALVIRLMRLKKIKLTVKWEISLKI